MKGHSTIGVSQLDIWPPAAGKTEPELRLNDYGLGSPTLRRAISKVY